MFGCYLHLELQCPLFLIGAPQEEHKLLLVSTLESFLIILIGGGLFEVMEGQLSSWKVSG